MHLLKYIQVSIHSVKAGKTQELQMTGEIREIVEDTGKICILNIRISVCFNFEHYW